MPYYGGLHGLDGAARARAAEGLVRLKQSLRDAGVPPKQVDGRLLLATWNIREFGGTKYGGRLPESLHYIAEVLDHFDVIAVQEVREDLAALEAVKRILGAWWDVIVTDVVEGRAGNGERMAFLYDRRKVRFSGLAGELVLPPETKAKVQQFARTPFVCGFVSGWSSFSLCTVHVYYGDDAPDEPRRVEEIRAVAEFLQQRGAEGAARARRSRIEPENLVLLGDFNIFRPTDPTVAALTDNGFVVPEAMKRRHAMTLGGSNATRDKFYDQIVFRAAPLKFGETGAAGVLDYYDAVFRAEDEAAYAGAMGDGYARAKNPSSYYRTWRTYQMSDHLVLWMEFRTDFSGEYLATVGAPPPAPGQT